MSNFCDKCGAEVKDENVKFCHKCGAEISVKQITAKDGINESGVICPHCGKAVPLGQTVCLNCGQHLEDNKTAIIIGYIVAFIFGIIGIIPGIYLLTRNNDKSKTQGLVILAMSIIPTICLWIFNFWVEIIILIIIVIIGVYLWTQN